MLDVCPVLGGARVVLYMAVSERADDVSRVRICNFLLKQSQKKVAFSMFAEVPHWPEEAVVPSNNRICLQKPTEGQPITRK